MRLSSVINRAMQINGDKMATDFLDRRRTWSEFQDRIARLGGALRELGVEHGDRIAVLSLNSDRYVEYFFGTPWAGAVFVPINIRLAPPEVIYWLNNSGSSVLLIDDAFMAMLPAIRDKLETVKTIIHIGEGETPEGLLSYEDLVGNAKAIEPLDSGGDELAGLFYTGGTTGRSKGVMLSHRNLLLNPIQFASIAGMNENMVYLHAAPMFHIANGTAMMATVNMAGSSVIIPAFDPVVTMQAIQDKKVNYCLLVPTMVNMVVNHPEIRNFDLSSLKRVIYGASPMPEAVIIKALKEIPEAEFRQAYGQTEAAPVLTMLEPERHTSEGPLAGKIKSCGRAILGVEIKIVDGDDNELPRGEVGEICARGENVMSGYWNLPELTAQALRNGWLHTGDGGYMDDEGYIFIVDRVKDMIISGGENVFSAEVEDAVHQHPAVAECAVIGIPDEKWGESVHAIVRCQEGQSATAEEIMGHCHELIAGFKCPRSVDFVADPLPLSGAGKILKTELRKPYWEGHEKQVN